MRTSYLAWGSSFHFLCRLPTATKYMGSSAGFLFSHHNLYSTAKFWKLWRLSSLLPTARVVMLPVVAALSRGKYCLAAYIARGVRHGVTLRNEWKRLSVRYAACTNTNWSVSRRVFVQVCGGVAWGGVFTVSSSLSLLQQRPEITPCSCHFESWRCFVRVHALFRCCILSRIDRPDWPLTSHHHLSTIVSAGY